MKKQKQHAAPAYATDAEGQQLVHVALANSNQLATLYAEDYQRLMGTGYSPHWALNDNGRGSAYVKANGKLADGRRTKLRIARMIAKASHGEHVRFVDRNSLNLRGDNLRLQKGRARYDHDDLLPNAASVVAMRQQDVHGATTASTRVHMLPWTSLRAHRVPARPTENQQTPSAPMTPATA